MTRRRLILIIGAVALLCVMALYAFFDPMEANWMPKCLIYVITGYKCPGCGSQRAMHALLTGDIAGAFQANAMMVLMIPVLALYIFAEFRRVSNPGMFLRLNSRNAVLGVAVLMLLWTLLRNPLGI